MKKFLILTLSLICMAFTSLAFTQSGSFSRAKAEELSQQTKVEVDTFLPTSALQLYDLVSPLSVSYSESGFMVITEHVGNLDGTSLFDRISVYNPNTKKYSAVSHDTIYNVTHATEWQGFIFYLSSSKLYYLPSNELTTTPTETTVTSSNFFMINGEFLITNTNNTIEVYKVSILDNTPTFEHLYTHKFTTKNAFLSKNNDLYYLFGGKLYCFDTATSTSYEVAPVTVDVNYMTELDNYVYLTSASGIYRVQKGKNQTLELITEISPASTTLGSVSNPQGVTVMNDMLVVADPDIKCVQGITKDGAFTDFAITVESTAEYRLTSNASHLCLSENYAYALDDGAQDENGISYKRIVRTALDKTAENRYSSISLASLYVGEDAIDVKYLACSDTHVAIYHGKSLSLYRINGTTLELVYETESESVTTLFYLDGEFYYTDYALKQFGYNAVNLYKLILPTEDNGNSEILIEKVNENVEIRGVAQNACVDVFGNFYLNVSETIEDTNYKIIRYSNGNLYNVSTNSEKFISFKADFAGNVYALKGDGTLNKYSYSLDENELNTFTFNTDLPVKSIDLNYRSEVCYILSNACILETVDDLLGIANLSEIEKANGLKTVISNVDGKFVTIDKNAKLFKVTLGEYDDDGNFNSITPVTNPRADKVYLIVDEIDNYYLVSYSDKFVALVRKTDTNYAPNSKFTSAFISKDYYDEFEIYETAINKTAVITNEVQVFSKPLFSSAYEISTLEKHASVHALNEVEFNGVSMTLISISEDKTPLGYVVTGYLNGELESAVTLTEKTESIVSGNGNRHFNNMLMVLIITLTVTLVALFIEKKLLFDKENGNKTN